MKSARIWVVVSATTALILLRPAVALFMVLALEMLIDGLIEAGVTGVSAIAIGAVGIQRPAIKAWNSARSRPRAAR